MPTGLDIATDSAPFIDAIRAADIDFIARYYRTASSHYAPLSASEARLVTSAGLSLVAVWEAASDKPGYFNRVSGVAAGTRSHELATQVGQPAGSAIYFAVDYDASGTDIVGCINEYFRGVHDGLGVAAGGGGDYRVGVYGSGAVCQALLQAGLADFAWLAMSTGWAGYRSFTGWHIKQGKPLAGLSFPHDSDAAKDSYGGFRVAPAAALSLVASGAPLSLGAGG